MTARRINFFLKTSERLRSLTQEVERNADLHRVLLDFAPSELTRACWVKQLRDGILTVSAENAAIAAKLKQLTARLLTAYQNQRFEVTLIRIEVQVRKSEAALPAKREARQLSTETIRSLDRLANDLEDSPLKQALTTLASRQRKKT